MRIPLNADAFQTVAPRTLLPVLRFPEASLAAARGVRACIFDVDGVLTDGTLYISEEGETLKAFHALDGHGLKLLAQGGITPIVITGRDSLAVRRRLKDLGLVHAVFGAHDKLAAAEPLLAQLGLSWPEVAALECPRRSAGPGPPHHLGGGRARCCP
jgi:3-deoxy-D-manno-octulosonate 8-phosphate phosphatase (KDO 8-P phosphatase)